MKVLLVVPHVFSGGAEKAALHLAYEMEVMGHEVSVASLSLDMANLPSKFKKLNYVVGKSLEPMPISGTYSVIKRYLKELRYLMDLISRQAKHYDIIVSFNFPSYWASVLASEKKPVVWICSEVFGSYRETRELYEKSGFFRAALYLASLIDKAIVDRIDRIITISEYNKAKVKERYGRNAEVIFPGVDFDYYSYPVAKPKGSLGLENVFVMIHVGDMVPSKNPLISLKTLKLLKERGIEAKLIYVGRGPLLNKVKKMAGDLGLKDDVLFLGRVSEEKLRLIYQAADVNLYPMSLQTWGIVPFEALAAGTISVVSNGIGASKLIEKEKIGLVVNPSPDSFAKAVQYIIEHKDEKKEMVRRGIEFVKNHLSWRTHAAKVSAVLEDLVKGR